MKIFFTVAGYIFKIWGINDWENIVKNIMGYIFYDLYRKMIIKIYCKKYYWIFYFITLFKVIKNMIGSNL